jgi:hypothetical protein
MIKALFEAANRCYTWEHVLTAAEFRGDAEELKQDLAVALAVQAYADEQGFDASPADVESAADEFRLEHELIAGEDLEQWLDHCGLTLDDFEGFFVRRLLADRFGDQADDIAREYVPSEADVAGHMWAEAILTGGYDALSVALARRVAVRLDGSVSFAHTDAQESAREAEGLLDGKTLDPEWLTELAEMEAAYAAAEQAALISEHRDREIRARFIQLTRIEIAEATFPSFDQAREAYQCVTGEGESLESVAARTGAAFDVATRFYDEVADEVRDLFFSAPAGKVFPPQQGDEPFAVREIRRRIEPEPGDPDVSARVRERLLANRFDAVVSQHVRWLFDPWNRT